MLTVEEALESLARTDEVWYEPEALRVKAAIFQAAPSPDWTAAEQCLEQALAAARARPAAFWELRAAVALATLQATRGRAETARSVLTVALRGFEDARNLPEVAPAFALLGRLSP